MNVTIPSFNDKQELFDYLRKNKSMLINQKKSAVKAPEYGFGIAQTNEDYLKPDSNKEFGIIATDTKKTTVKCVINASNIIDSYLDLHLPKLFNRSVKNNKDPLHLQEHKMLYDFIIGDGLEEVKSYVTTMSWKNLGYEFEGKTDLLMHDVYFTGRNPTMEERYKANQVKYHSVGMQYVELFFCVDSEEKWWREEKDNFDQYIEMAVNPDVAKENGYFWAVKEAKEVEGSAVVRGACPTTPTISISKGLGSTTPLENSGSSDDTRKANEIKIIKNLNLI